MNKVAVPWNLWNSIAEFKLIDKFLEILLQRLKSQFPKFLNPDCCRLSALLLIAYFQTDYSLNTQISKYWNIFVFFFSFLFRFPIQMKSKSLQFVCSCPCVKLCLYHRGNDICPSFCHFFGGEPGFITWYSLEYHVTSRISVSIITEQSELQLIFPMFSLG